ncbi:unnamed protein product, partial [marine sediment metagenome]
MKMLKNSFLRPFCLTILALLLVSCASGEEETFNIKSNYLKAEHMIPMRDGVNLYTQVYTPLDKSQEYPIMLFRTPYSIGYYQKNSYRQTLGPNNSFAKETFVFVYQDVRGKFKSEGDFTVMRP